MEIKAKTLYNIGDPVWVYRYMTDYEDHNKWGYGIEERTIKYIRAIVNNNGIQIQYYLNGLYSYEGENWFDQESPEFGSYADEGIFGTKQEAQEYLEYCEEAYGRT